MSGGVSHRHAPALPSTQSALMPIFLRLVRGKNYSMLWLTVLEETVAPGVVVEEVAEGLGEGDRLVV